MDIAGLYWGIIYAHYILLHKQSALKVCFSSFERNQWSEIKLLHISFSCITFNILAEHGTMISGQTALLSSACIIIFASIHRPNL